MGYRLRHHARGPGVLGGRLAERWDEITRLEQAIAHVAGKAVCMGDPVFLPRDESSAWAWLPLGIRNTFDPAAAAGVDADIRFAFGDAAKGPAGFRLTHRQALAAQSVALAAGHTRRGRWRSRGRGDRDGRARVR